MTTLALIVIMAILARQSGGGLGAKYLPRSLTWLPEALFAVPIGYAGAVGMMHMTDADFPPPIAFAAACVWSYLWMQTGHGTVLQWGSDPSKAVGRAQTLTPVINWIAARLGLTVGDVGYCRLFMAVKGFLIGLPAGGLPLAFLWPLAYEIGVRLRRHEVSELLSGAFAGALVSTVL